jgi:hypothetical protein
MPREREYGIEKDEMQHSRKEAVITYGGSKRIKTEDLNSE